MQSLPFAHSSDFVHEVAHALPAQRYGAHAAVTAAEHVPFPSHDAASVATSSMQDASRHDTEVSARAAHRLPSLPSQLEASHALEPFAHAGRTPCGVPFTATHLPTLPATSQAWHCPPHRDSQHTPSTQLPDPHSPSAAHASPSIFAQRPADVGSAQDFPAPQVLTPQHTPSVHERPPSQGADVLHGMPSPGAGTHAALLHTKPEAQSLVTEQVVLHALEPQANAPQVFGTSLHRPTPLHVLACDSTPSAHAAVLQLLVAGG
jgi:hypothetical protein